MTEHDAMVWNCILVDELQILRLQLRWAKYIAKRAKRLLDVTRPPFQILAVWIKQHAPLNSFIAEPSEAKPLGWQLATPLMGSAFAQPILRSFDYARFSFSICGRSPRAFAVIGARGIRAMPGSISKV